MSETNLDDMLDAEASDSDDLDLGGVGALGGDDADDAEGSGGLDDLAADFGDFGGDNEPEATDSDESGGGGLEDLAGDLGELSGGGDDMDFSAGDDTSEGGGGLEDLAGDLGELSGGGDDMDFSSGDDAGEGGGMEDLAGALAGIGGGDDEGTEDGAGERDVVAASRAQLSSTEAVNLDFLLDVKLDVTFEVGRAKMVISDLLTLGQGSVVELHRLVGEELDFMVNGKLIAKGEVVVVNEKFGCRISEIVAPVDRIKHLGNV